MSDPFQSAIDGIYAQLGKPALYDSADDGEKAVRIIVSYDLTQWGDQITVQDGSAVVSVRKSEVLARPRRGDTFAQEDTRVFRVDRVVLSDDLEHRCLAVQDED